MVALAGPEQRDALAELVHIGVGQAGASLAQLFETFITPSISRIEIVQPHDFPQAIATVVDEPGPIVAVRQAFSSRIRGEAIVVSTAGGRDALADAVSFPGGSSDELVLEVSNVLVGACVGRLAAQLALDLSFAPPSLVGPHASVHELLEAGGLAWRNALVAEVQFQLVDRAFRCHLFTLWPDESIDELLAAVDAFLASLM
ncbi:MAG TPA: hypothetical protein VFP84_19085 [Kofleriaceae bacterium]|nr:hypothetical protein [Kofleriaceae bacterium]